MLGSVPVDGVPGCAAVHDVADSRPEEPMRYFAGVWASLEIMAAAHDVLLSGLLVALIWTVALCWGGR